MPVELFAAQANATLTAGQVAEQLNGSFPEGSDVRVAVPVDTTHHRCLTILTVGFGAGTGEDVIEVGCERWDGPDAVIRMNQPAEG